MATRTARPPSSGRYARAYENPQVDPRTHLPNPNPPVGTVGPNVPAGFGDSHVKGSLHAEPWAGWPGQWHTPWMEDTPTDWTFFGYGASDPAGFTKRVSTVMTCVDLNTRQLASFPIYGVNRNRPERLPSWSRNPEPTMYSSWSEFMKVALNLYQLRGEAMLWATARFADGYPSRFVAIDVDHVEILDRHHDEVPADYGWSDTLDDFSPGIHAFRYKGRWLHPDDVCRIKNEVLATGGPGVSPISWLGRNLVGAAALERYAADIANHGVFAILKNPANLNATQRDDAKNNWMNARAGRPGAPAVLSGQWEFDTLSLSPKDMALLDLRIFDEQHIAAAFGVPPYLVGLPQSEGLTYANASGLFDYHWRATLRTMAQSFSDAMSEWLLPGGKYIEFNRDEYVRPGLYERAQTYQILHGIEDADGHRGIELDEIRIAERLEPHHDEPAELTDALTGER